MGMRGVRCIFFDVGYTFVNEDDVWTQRCLEQAAMAEARLLGISHRQIFEEMIEASIACQPPYKSVLKKLGLAQAAPYRPDFEKLYDGADLVLRTLACKYDLGIIANQLDGLADRLDAWGILNCFSHIFSSWDYQIKKPDARLFQLALEKSGYSPFETVMVGDRLDNDIFPAKALGMNTIWIRQGFGGMQKPITPAYVPDVEIANLDELLSIF